MIRLVVDPGVLVSAAIVPLGAPAQLLALIRDGAADLVASPTLLDELRGVLTRPRFRRYLTLEQVDRFMTLIERLAIMDQDPRDPPRVVRDAGDDYLVALAKSAGVVAIVSGDKDLIALRDLSPPVVTPREAVKRLSL